MNRFSKNIQYFALAFTVVLFTQCTEDDLNSPIITLLGANPEFVALGTSYTEAGAEANDEEDGVISVIDVDDSALNTSTVGSYDILYSATDDAGNVGSAVRTVHVFAQASNYAGVYAVEEDCSDGNTYNYNVTITAGASPNTLLVSNFGNYGGAVIVNIGLSDDTNSTLSVNDMAGGATFIGVGILTTGTTTSMIFTLDYDSTSGADTLNCVGTFTKQ